MRKMLGMKGIYFWIFTVAVYPTSHCILNLLTVYSELNLTVYFASLYILVFFNRFLQKCLYVFLNDLFFVTAELVAISNFRISCQSNTLVCVNMLYSCINWQHFRCSLHISMLPYVCHNNSVLKCNKLFLLIWTCVLTVQMNKKFCINYRNESINHTIYITNIQWKCINILIYYY